MRTEMEGCQGTRGLQRVRKGGWREEEKGGNQYCFGRSKEGALRFWIWSLEKRCVKADRGAGGEKRRRKPVNLMESLRRKTHQEVERGATS